MYKTNSTPTSQFTKRIQRIHKSLSILLCTKFLECFVIQLHYNFNVYFYGYTFPILRLVSSFIYLQIFWTCIPSILAPSLLQLTIPKEEDRYVSYIVRRNYPHRLKSLLSYSVQACKHFLLPRNSDRHSSRFESFQKGNDNTTNLELLNERINSNSALLLPYTGPLHLSQNTSSRTTSSIYPNNHVVTMENRMNFHKGEETILERPRRRHQFHHMPPIQEEERELLLQKTWTTDNEGVHDTSRLKQN